jgi:YD repeat-containing protein
VFFSASTPTNGAELWTYQPGSPSATRAVTYAYDGLQRLTSATESGTSTATYTYTYDLAGNRTSATVNGVTTARSYNAANQVSGWTYDAVGNLTSDGTTTYGYDALNRQTTTGGTTNSYNGDGVLVQQGATHYTQDLIAPLSQILGDGTQTFVYGYERLYGQTGTTNKTWYGSDALGSVRYTMDAAGTPSAPITYNLWETVLIILATPARSGTGSHPSGGLQI